MIRLLVDSASDYTQEEIRNKNLYFVPLQIQIEGKNYLDGVDIDKETFYEKMMNSKEFPVFRGLHHECLEAILRKS